MDYKELIELSQKAADEWRNDHSFYQAGTLIDSLCFSIETLLAERDAAVEDLHGVCRVCVSVGCFEGAQPCCDCTYGTGVEWDADNWQWRGPQKGDTQ